MKKTTDDGLSKFLDNYAKKNHICSLEWAQHDVWEVCIDWSDKMVKKVLKKNKMKQSIKHRIELISAILEINQMILEDLDYDSDDVFVQGKRLENENLRKQILKLDGKFKHIQNE
jgi:hypothetical protein